MANGKIGIYGDPTAPVCVLQPTGAHETAMIPEELAELDRLCPDGKRCLVTVAVDDWNRDLSPWKADPVFGTEPFGDGAEETLRVIENEVLPYLSRACPVENRRLFLCGYSLAGLFSLWASCRSDRFDGVAGVSPSVWFPGWLDYARIHPTKARAVYLSLGDREEKAKNPLLASVGDAIRKQYALLCDAGVPATLEWNAGNHFVNAPQRLARAVAWLEKNVL